MLLCLGVKSEGHCCKGTLERCICCHIAGAREQILGADYCLHAERQEQLEREIEKRRHDLSVREATLADAERASERKWRDLSRELHDKVRQPCWKFDWASRPGRANCGIWLTKLHLFVSAYTDRLWS